MISISSGLKDSLKESSRQLKGYIDYGDNIIRDDDDLISLKISWKANFTTAIIRVAQATYKGGHSLLNQYVELGIGAVLPDNSTEYIDYGSFKVVEVETNEASEHITAKMYDKMYDSLIPYDIDPIYDITFPVSLKELLEAICTRLNWTLATSTFPNDDTEITSDPFTGLGLSFRNVLDQIAQASGSVLFFNNSDELVVKQIAATSLETLDKNLLRTLKVSESYGPVNSVVLSRMPQEDNIVQNS